MNAGAHGQSISDNLLRVKILDAFGNVRHLGRDELRFAYRTSHLPPGSVILDATFRFDGTGDGEYFRSIRNDLLKWRRAHQPSGLNFGSVFRNGDDFSAGELIDGAGMKGKSIGGASVSMVHANFIVSDGTATARDVEALIDAVRCEVYKKFKKFLRCEVVILRP
jgi:UDP-N-acetylmuramate dehydrogenase